jgi:hypothetical protein
MVDVLMDKEWPDEDYFDDEEKNEFDEWRETDNARRQREYEQENRQRSCNVDFADVYYVNTRFL